MDSLTSCPSVSFIRRTVLLLCIEVVEPNSLNIIKDEYNEYNEYNERILNKIKTIKIIQKAGYSEQGWNSEMGSNIFMIKKIEDNYFLIFDFVTIFIDKLCCYRELVEC